MSAAVKKVPGVPLLYIILNTIVLDKPSQRSVTHVQAVQSGEFVTPMQQQNICKLKEEQGIAQDGAKVCPKKRKRKVKHPNPLSCLKRKKKPGVPATKKMDGEKKKRSRNKRRKTDGAEGGIHTTTPVGIS